MKEYTHQNTMNYCCWQKTRFPSLEIYQLPEMPVRCTLPTPSVYRDDWKSLRSDRNHHDALSSKCNNPKHERNLVRHIQCLNALLNSFWYNLEEQRRLWEKWRIFERHNIHSNSNHCVCQQTSVALRIRVWLSYPPGNDHISHLSREKEHHDLQTYLSWEYFSSQDGK